MGQRNIRVPDRNGTHAGVSDISLSHARVMLINSSFTFYYRGLKFTIFIYLSRRFDFAAHDKIRASVTHSAIVSCATFFLIVHFDDMNLSLNCLWFSFFENEFLTGSSLVVTIIPLLLVTIICRV